MDLNRARTVDTGSNEFKDVKLNGKFVGELVYEWVRRMKAYSGFTLSNSIIQSMALQFKLVLNMTSFFPNTAWINRFRATYNLWPTYTTKLKNAYTEKKSVQVGDIIRDLLHKAKLKAPSEVQVIQEPVEHSDGPDVEIIEIEDEVKREYEVMGFDTPPSDATSAGVEEAIIDDGLTAVNQIPDEVTKYSEVVDFEKELPSSVVLNYTTQKEPADVIDDVLNRDDMEDFIPALVCSSKKLKFEQPKQRKLGIPASVRVACVTNHRKTQSIKPPDDIPTKRMRSATSTASPVENIVEDAEAESLLVPIPEPIDVDLSETIELKKVETDTVTAAIPVKTYSIPSTLTIKKISTPPEIPRKRTRFLNRQPLKTREEALKCIKLMEEFAMMKENFRLIGFIERLEKLIMNGK